MEDYAAAQGNGEEGRLMGEVTNLVRAARRDALTQVLTLLREQDNYWNSVAYDKRQAGKSDIGPSARAGQSMSLAVFVERMRATDQ